jgi:hypothetical protein
MTTKNETKLKKLFSLLQPGKIVTASWLESFGISRDLQKYYLESGWLEALGRGAYKKPGHPVEWHGALNAIQEQIKTKVHVGGLTALLLQGFSHYSRMSNETIYLFSPRKENLPKWFTDYNWKVAIEHKKTLFLPGELGIKSIEINQNTVLSSVPERAIMECLFLAPQKMDLVECYYLFEGLVNLKPRLVTELLENCKSVKAKRLFLYMADKANHQWFKFLSLEKVDIGTGNRILVDKGIFQSKYLISVPRELAEL